ncbi:MAG: DNA polymerase III, subunit gamma and tau [Chloroflexi bacterium RBG_13_68_17]|nr:MAG: DNA polymerase III, subunit gamma and tau [Chloroflexi bacterium RBG_13_68_17]
MTQALYRRWRPQTWDEVVGQEHVVQTLRNAVRGDRWAHAYLLAGPRGTGKTTVARLLAKAANCLAESTADRPCNACEHCAAVNAGTFLDLIEIDAASNTSVEDVRDLRERINFRPNQGRVKVYIIDEVHMLSTAAFNALLKTLEEPPAHARFVLATTEVHKIPATVLSRCQRHEFRRIPVATISEALQGRCAAEGLQVEPRALDLIARQSTGSLRDAISLLDQLTSTGEAVSLEQAQQVLGTATSEAVRSVVRALAERQAGPGLQAIHQALDAGSDPRQLARQVVEYLRGVVLTRLSSEAGLDVVPEVQAEMAEMARAIALPVLLAGLNAFQKAAAESRGNWQPGLPIELALIEACAERAEVAAPPASTPAATRTSGSAPRPATPATPAAPVAPPRPPTKTAQVPPSAPSDPAGPTFDQVRTQWQQVLTAAYRRDPRTQALLNSGRPMGMEAGALVLGFNSDLLRERMERKENLALVRQCFEDVFGAPLNVRCVLSRGWTPNGDPPQAAESIEDGGMVATAVRDLGAQVVDVKPLSPEGS